MMMLHRSAFLRLTALAVVTMISIHTCLVSSFTSCSDHSIIRRNNNCNAITRTRAGLMNTKLFQSSRGPSSIINSRSSGSKSKTRRRKMKQRHYFTAPISYNETMLHNDMTLYDIGASEDNEDNNNNNSPVMRSYV
jgi:hypothetical protein